MQKLLGQNFKYLCCLFGLFISQLLIAQPQTWRSASNVSKGKKASYYARNAKKYAKKGREVLGLMYAARCLSSSPKKKNIKTAVEVLNTYYEKGVTRIEKQIETDKLESAVIKNNREVNRRYDIVKAYKELAKLQAMLAEVPVANFKPKKAPTFSYVSKDYTADLAAAEELFEKAKTEVVELFYTKANAQYDSAKTVQQYRAAAMVCQLTMEYDKNYKEVTKLFAKAKKKGTTHLVMHTFNMTNRGMIDGLKGAETEYQISGNFFKNHGKAFPYFDFQPADPSGMHSFSSLSAYNQSRNQTSRNWEKRQVFHYRLTGDYLSHDVRADPLKRETETVSKEVVLREEKYKDDEGKEQKRKIKGTVKATITYFTLETHVKLAVSARIQKIDDGKVERSEDFSISHTHSYRWATYTGDKRAIGYQWQVIEREPRNKLEPGEAVKAASQKLADEVVSKLLEPFARQYGAPLRSARR